MDNYTLTVTDHLQFLIEVVFDSLEYVSKRDSYSMEAYKKRKNILEGQLKENSNISHYISNSGEFGKKLKEKLEALFATLYSDESNIVKLSQDGSELRVDYSQATDVFEKVLPLYEDFLKIVRSMVLDLKKKEKLDEPSLEECIYKFESFSRGALNLMLLNELNAKMSEFNKVKNEAKGADTPQSNFIGGYISRLINLVAFARQNSGIISTEYYSFIDPLFAYIEIITGRREAPKDETPADTVKKIRDIGVEFTSKWEESFKVVYNDIRKKFIEAVQKLNEKKLEGKA